MAFSFLFWFFEDFNGDERNKKSSGVAFEPQARTPLQSNKKRLPNAMCLI
jgi:hypothetical protein